MTTTTKTHKDYLTEAKALLNVDEDSEQLTEAASDMWIYDLERALSKMDDNKDFQKVADGLEDWLFKHERSYRNIQRQGKTIAARLLDSLISGLGINAP